MFKDAFKKQDRTESRAAAELLNPHFDVFFDPDTASVLTHPLAFYNGHALVEISQSGQHPCLRRTAIVGPEGRVYPLNWTNAPIYALNAAAPLVLRDDTMTDYVRFFFAYVRGAQGRFSIVDSVDDIVWREEPSPSGRKALGRMIEPLHIKSRGENGDAFFALCFTFKNSLFHAEAHLSKDGRIAMMNEELLVEDIPVADEFLEH